MFELKLVLHRDFETSREKTYQNAHRYNTCKQQYVFIRTPLLYPITFFGDFLCSCWRAHSHGSMLTHTQKIREDVRFCHSMLNDPVVPAFRAGFTLPLLLLLSCLIDICIYVRRHKQTCTRFCVATVFD